MYRLCKLNLKRIAVRHASYQQIKLGTYRSTSYKLSWKPRTLRAVTMRLHGVLSLKTKLKTARDKMRLKSVQ